MGSRSLACALVRHRQAEPRGARRRPWTFDRAGPNCYVLRARTTPDSYRGVYNVVLQRKRRMRFFASQISILTIWEPAQPRPPPSPT